MTDSSGTCGYEYTYDSIYQLTAVDYPASLSYLATDTTFDYDAAGNRTSVIDGSGTCTYTTNSLNQYTAAGSVSYQYDASGNLVHDQNYAYGYDPENRLVMVHQSGSLPPVSLNQALESSLTYTTGGDAAWQVYSTGGYGDWDSVRSPELEQGQESWLQTTVEGEGTFSFWAQLQQWNAGNEMRFYVDGVLRYGCETSSWEYASFEITGAGTHTLKWVYRQYSDENYSTGYVDAVGWTGSAAPAPEPPVNAWHRLEYTYDAFGRRIAKSYNEELITSYVYDGDSCIAEYDLNGNLKRKYIFGPCTDEPICMIEAGSSYAGTYYYHFDALGSVVALTNSSGNTVEVYEYSVFGQVGASDPNHPNRFMFTGREFDKETGLYYYRARYYNPQIGRFLQTDPVGYGAGMNVYGYCGNSPVGSVDPSGCDPDALGFEDFLNVNFYTFEARFHVGVIADSSGGPGDDAWKMVTSYFDQIGFADDWPGWMVEGAHVDKDPNYVDVRFVWWGWTKNMDKPIPHAPRMNDRVDILEGGSHAYWLTIENPKDPTQDVYMLTPRMLAIVIAPETVRIDGLTTTFGDGITDYAGLIWNLLHWGTWFENGGTFKWSADKKLYGGSDINYIAGGYMAAHYNMTSLGEELAFRAHKGAIRRHWPWDHALARAHYWWDLGIQVYQNIHQ